MNANTHNVHKCRFGLHRWNRQGNMRTCLDCQCTQRIEWHKGRKKLLRRWVNVPRPRDGSA